MYMNIESFLFYQVIKNFLMTPKFKIDAEISSDIAYNKMFIFWTLTFYFRMIVDASGE